MLQCRKVIMMSCSSNCAVAVNDGSMRDNDVLAILDHRLKVRAQKNSSCSETKIAVITNGPAGDWLLVDLCEDAKGRCRCATAVDK